MEEQKKHDREFKVNAVKLYRKSGKTLEEMGKDLGIPKSTFYGWVKEFKENGKWKLLQDNAVAQSFFIL